MTLSRVGQHRLRDASGARVPGRGSALSRPDMGGRSGLRRSFRVDNPPIHLMPVNYAAEHIRYTQNRRTKVRCSGGDSRHVKIQRGPTSNALYNLDLRLSAVNRCPWTPLRRWQRHALLDSGVALQARALAGCHCHRVRPHRLLSRMTCEAAPSQLPHDDQDKQADRNDGANDGHWDNDSRMSHGARYCHGRRFCWEVGGEGGDVDPAGLGAPRCTAWRGRRQLIDKLRYLALA